MKVHIARDGVVIGEWTQTELRRLLRASELFPSDYYCRLGMTEWKRLAELPSGKSVLATPAQRQMLADYGLPFDEFTTKYQVSKLMESRPCTEKQRLFMDDLGIVHFEGMTIKEASDLIDAELSGEAPDGPATPKQMAMLRALAAAAKLDLPISSPTRRDAATGIGSLRGYVDTRQRRR